MRLEYSSDSDVALLLTQPILRLFHGTTEVCVYRGLLLTTFVLKNSVTLNRRHDNDLARYKFYQQGDDPFYCPHCQLTIQQSQIKDLKSTIDTLSKEIMLIKSTMT